MATTNQWVAPAAIATALSSELNSLANGAYTSASTTIDNETGLYLYIAVELVLASLTPTGTPYAGLYLIPSIDTGTNFEDIPSTTNLAYASLLCNFDLGTSTSAKRRVITGLIIPPLQFKLSLLNGSGVAFASSGNTVRYRRYNEQSV